MMQPENISGAEFAIRYALDKHIIDKGTYHALKKDVIEKVMEGKLHKTTEVYRIYLEEEGVYE